MTPPPIVDVIECLAKLAKWYGDYCEKFPHVKQAKESYQQVTDLLSRYSQQLFDEEPGYRWKYWQTYASASAIAFGLHQKGKIPVPVIGRPPGTGWRQQLKQELLNGPDLSRLPPATPRKPIPQRKPESKRTRISGITGPRKRRKA